MTDVENVNPVDVETSGVAAGGPKGRVLLVTSRVLWAIGLILALSVVGSWFSDIPVRFYESFPYPVPEAADIWEIRRVTSDRMTIVGTVGLGCLALAGLVRLASGTRRGSPTKRSAWAVLLGVLATILSLLVLAATTLELLLLSIDPSDTPL